MRVATTWSWTAIGHGRRRTGRVAMVALIALVVTVSGAPAEASHLNRHKYSIARESHHAGDYSGNQHTRYDAHVACASGSSYYQSNWVAWDVGNFVEFGTGHCWWRGTEWYWLYVDDGTFNYVGYRDATPGEVHTFGLQRVEYSSYVCWYEVVSDFEVIDTLTAPEGCAGANWVDAGSETYDLGHQTIVDTSGMRKQLFGGYWYEWHGFDYERVDGPEMCGRWLSTTQWRQSENQPC